MRLAMLQSASRAGPPPARRPMSSAPQEPPAATRLSTLACTPSRTASLRKAVALRISIPMSSPF